MMNQIRKRKGSQGSFKQKKDNKEKRQKEKRKTWDKRNNESLD